MLTNISQINLKQEQYHLFLLAIHQHKKDTFFTTWKLTSSSPVDLSLSMNLFFLFTTHHILLLQHSLTHHHQSSKHQRNKLTLHLKHHSHLSIFLNLLKPQLLPPHQTLTPSPLLLQQQQTYLTFLSQALLHPIITHHHIQTPHLHLFSLIPQVPPHHLYLPSMIHHLKIQAPPQNSPRASTRTTTLPTRLQDYLIKLPKSLTLSKHHFVNFINYKNVHTPIHRHLIHNINQIIEPQTYN